jgi:hypothetical protein
MVPKRRIVVPTCKTADVTVHRLMFGRSACMMTDLFGVPGGWPEGHKWSNLWIEVNCPKCKITQ